MAGRDAIRFDALTSRNPLVGFRAHERIDPYFHGLWESRSGAAWWDRDVFGRLGEAGLVQRSRWSKPDDQAASMVDAVQGKFGPRRVAALAAINLWRTLTGEQLAAITGCRSFALRDSADLHRLWSAGLIDVGKVATPGDSSIPRLVRPRSKGDWSVLFSLLTFDDWVGLTAGQDWRWGSQHERHNVLTSELALRAAEFTDVKFVFGEQLGSLQAINPAGVRLSAQQSRLAADAVLVRSDGLLIMVELTVTASNFEAKAARWASLLNDDANHSMAVVFVHAPHPSQSGAANHDKISKAISGAARESISYVLNRVPDRMMLVSWRDWFPHVHAASPDFLTLSARRPSGVSELNRWESVQALDPFDLAGPRHDPEILRNAHYLYGVPHWLREVPDESPSQMWCRLNGVSKFPAVEGVPLPPQVRAKLRS